MGIAPVTDQGAIYLEGCNAKVSWNSNSLGDFISEINIKDSMGDW